jgi:DNA-binding response OmpR family regulator
MPAAILLVDDDLDLLPSLVATLTDLSDFHVLSAENGQRGLEMVFAHRPDCVVVDVKMPELNGYQFVQAMRGDPETASIPLVILSALVQEHDKYTGLITGVDYYLTKPVEPEELINTINAAMQLREEDRIQRIRELAESDPPAS